MVNQHCCYRDAERCTNSRRIIVGVKYCFRYNRRARALAALGADGENGEIDLSALNRPRRRREKKWMTMDEVNERFPLTKYKVWRATREREGLPTAGGVTATPSRAGSISTRSVKAADKAGRPSISERQVADSSTEIETIPPRPSTSNRKDLATTSINEEDEQQSSSTSMHAHNTAEERHGHLEEIPLDESAQTSTIRPQEQDESGDEDDPIMAAVPMNAGEAGDSCAICLDTLDDDDEVRGLTCGHAFHAGCLDPWLTSRRACCPLCKADYYIPKPRDPNTPADPPQLTPLSPAAIWMGGRGFYPRQRTFVMGGRLATVNIDDLGYHDLRAVQAIPTATQRTRRSGREGLTGRLLGNARRHLPFAGRDTPARPARDAPNDQEQQEQAATGQSEVEVPGVMTQQGQRFTYVEPLGRALPNPGDLESGIGRGAGMHRGGMTAI